MGMRDDLSKDLKTLLDSEVIRGKVAVQRAYADWRRYPQYIVPLSEASIDLIFAPAYGSSKKNATDIRLAIDALELVFTRPEIGVYILLSGDSDFSSLVLKLKEYGKYVVGVGIRESSSDILVQNCDEYYSYTALAGLQKETGEGGVGMDPWELVEAAVDRMDSRGDVMRSDRLKQVMLEIDQGFDEGDYGYSKFSRFVTDAASRGLLKLKKMDNGQYEVQPARGGGAREPRKETSREGGKSPESRRKPARPEAAPEVSGAPLEDAYDLLRRSITVAGGDDGPVRDSDVKRKMLQFEPGFDEGELGFGKFSRFLQQAEDAGVVEIRRTEDGNYQVTLGGTAPGTVEPEDAEEEEAASASGSRKESTLARLRRRRSSSRKGKRAGPPAGETDEPPILDGQAVAEASTSTEAAVEEEAPTRERETPAEREEPRPAEPADDEAAPESASGEGPPIFEGQGIPAGGGGGREPGPATEPEPEPEPEEPEPEPAAPAPEPEEASAESRSSLRMRRGSRKGSGAKAGGADGGPSLLEGQAVTLDESPSSGRSEQSTPTAERRTGPPSEPRAQRAGPRDAADEIAELNLPTDRGAITRYLANRYRGVGEKTAERLVDTFGTDVFRVLHEEPHRVRDLLTDSRAEQVLDAWSDDYRRRTGARSGSGVSS